MWAQDLTSLCRQPQSKYEIPQGRSLPTPAPWPGPQTVAGHVSRKMLEHYSHIRMEAKRDAVLALSGAREGSETAGHVTKHVTNEPGEPEPVPHVIENVVDVAGIEPATPCLQSRCSPS